MVPVVDAGNFLRFDLSASFFRLGAMSLHCDSAQLLEFASSTNPYGLTFAELLSLSALAQRAMALRALAHGRLAQYQIALEGGDGPTGLEKYGVFLSKRQMDERLWHSIQAGGLLNGIDQSFA
jgi:hypothetical protein